MYVTDSVATTRNPSIIIHILTQHYYSWVCTCAVVANTAVCAIQLYHGPMCLVYAFVKPVQLRRLRSSTAVPSEVRSWGHMGGEGGSIILKSDGEKSIVALKEAVAKFHGGKVIPEQAARGESQSNGAVEESGREIREFTRVLKEQI